MVRCSKKISKGKRSKGKRSKGKRRRMTRKKYCMRGGINRQLLLRLLIITALNQDNMIDSGDAEDVFTKLNKGNLDEEQQEKIKAEFNHYGLEMEDFKNVPVNNKSFIKMPQRGENIRNEIDILVKQYKEDKRARSLSTRRRNPFFSTRTTFNKGSSSRHR